MLRKEVILRQDNEYSKPYHWMWNKNLERLFNLRTQITLNSIGSLERKKILDFGCGDGKFSSILLENNAAYVAGVDISTKALRFARCLVPKADFFEISNGILPFDNDVFDIVFCLDVLEHIPDDEIKLWVSEIHRVLESEGCFIFSVPSKLKNLDEKHFRHYTPKELEVFLKDYFETFKFQGYFIRLPIIPVRWIDKLYNKGTIWKLFTLLVRKCSLNKALYIAGIGNKKK